MANGVARVQDGDLEAYRERLKRFGAILNRVDMGSIQSIRMVAGLAACGTNV